MPRAALPALPSIAELGAAFRAGRTSPVEATEACLARIAARDPALHAFITVTADAARADAQRAADELGRGRDRGPLHGVPIALKDLIDTAGVATTGGSAQFVDRVPDADAEVVRRLRAAGAVILGKLNLHELAYGASGVVGHFPATRNPHAPDHIAGGSSSGSGAAVAAGLCYAALGSDTSGSIRIPAALCGVVGFMPSHGLVSARGVLPLAWSYDRIGPLTRSVRDAALVLQVIAGFDPADPMSAPLPIADYAAAVDAGAPPVRIGVPRAQLCTALHPEVARAFDRAVAAIAAHGAELADVELPIDDDRTVFRAEAWAFHRGWVERSPERYQAETLRRIRTGEAVTAAAYLERAHELVRLRRAIATVFAEVDLIVSPTVSVPAPSFAELAAAPEQLRDRELVFMRTTRPWSVWGTPAISLPCGATADGLPIGVQLAGPIGADAQVLRHAAALERALTAAARS
jgi:aspartyl-tRNA(Asn)/glutamyl-tRNA(Gln) amidotransferase subunit A